MERSHHVEPGPAGPGSSAESLVPPELHDRLDYLLCKLADVTKKRADDSFLAATGIRGAHHAVLRVLKTQGGISQRNLAQALFVDQSTIVDLIDQLQRQGLVERDRDPADRRAYLLRLTTNGTRTLRKADRTAVSIQGETFGGLDDAQQAALREAITSLLSRKPS
ncbi:MarR family winged helix-turn-helix transcriptional regulator [Kribbella sp. NPDC004536]|uniref:MarR family winged helix-turn-helix transcriptional regulator n=1 Tax=Kribbella sp. NPDC004536 TaxID=3364106 RepID=UPI0036B46866